MITGSLIVLSLVLGYLITVGLSLAATFGITAMHPAFVARGHRLGGRYQLLHSFVWLLCAAVGGYVTAFVTGAALLWFACTTLASILVAIIWRNSSEAQQRGLGHMVLVSLLTVAGVAAGYALRLH